ncbi:hypothetical protein HYV44_02075 [Candidatus Microgenomates bacterium]|nr:hypothetical protein [Candidatus Microgenomates bacterium]
MKKTVCLSLALTLLFSARAMVANASPTSLWESRAQAMVACVTENTDPTAFPIPAELASLCWTEAMKVALLPEPEGFIATGSAESNMPEKMRLTEKGEVAESEPTGIYAVSGVEAPSMTVRASYFGGDNEEQVLAMTAAMFEPNTTIVVERFGQTAKVIKGSVIPRPVERRVRTEGLLPTPIGLGERISLIPTKSF